MKKIIVMLLMFMVAGIGFSWEVTPTIDLRMDLGAKTDLSNSPDDPTWVFDPYNNGTAIGAKVTGKNAGGWMHLRGDAMTDPYGGLFGELWVKLRSATVAAGRTEAWAQWSDLDLFGDNNWAFGASTSMNRPFIKIILENFYFGIHEAGINGKYIGAKHSVVLKDNAPLPGFFIGCDFIQEGALSGGAIFAGQYLGDDINDGSFPLMFNVHTRILAYKPITFGFNISFYISPENAPDFFAINSCPVLTGNPGSGGSRVVESMIDFTAKLIPCDMTISAAYVMDIIEENSGIKVGASFKFTVGDTGFSFIPGAMYTNILLLDGQNAKTSWLDLGMSCLYSF